MTRSRFAAGLLAGTAFIGALAGVQVWKQAQYGRGPVVSSTPAERPAREIAFVANAVGGTVTLIDPAQASVVGEIDIIPDGRRPGIFRDPLQFFAQPRVEAEGGLNYAQDSDLSRDGRVLFVSRGHLGDVAAFDIATGAMLWRTPVAGLRADHMAISPDGERLYVATLIYSGDAVEVIDTANGRRLGRFTAGRWPHDIHVTSDGRHVLVASLGDMSAPRALRGEETNAYTVTIAETGSLDVVGRVWFEAGVRPFQLDEDTGRLYAQLSNTHDLVVADLETGAMVDRLPLPVAPGVDEDDWDFEAPHHGLALADDILCVAGRASDYAGFVRALDLTLIETVPVGDAPSWSAFTAEGKVCLLANNRSDDVSLVARRQTPSGPAFEEIARLPAGRGPKHISVGEVPEAVIASLQR